MKLLTFFAVFFTLLVQIVPAQDSSFKEQLLAARQREKERPARERARRSMTLEQQLTQGDGGEEYPEDTMDWGNGFSEGLAKVTVHGKAGFIDRSGKLVIPARLKDAGQFSEGLAPYETSGGRWGYIDKQGKTVIAPRFDWATTFHEGRALVQAGELWGYFDTTGAMVVRPQFLEASGFYEGLAHVAVAPNTGSNERPWKHGFIDRSGKFVIPPTWDYADDFSEGRTIVDHTVRFVNDPKYGNNVVGFSQIIDQTGATIAELGPNHVFGYSENLLVVEKGRTAKGFPTYIFMDRDGNRQPREFESLSPFAEGLASARRDGKDGFINHQGEFVIEPRFEMVHSFSEGLAAAAPESFNQWGFIGRDGVFVISPRFSWAWRFSGGFALVAQGRKTGYVDKQGNYIWNPTE